MAIPEHECSDDYHGRDGHGKSRRVEHDHGDLGQCYRFHFADGDFRDIGIDRGDAGESFDCEGDDETVHGDGDFFRQFDAEFDQYGYLDFADHRYSYDCRGWVSHRGDGRNEPDSGCFGSH